MIDIHEQAIHRWPGILQALGIDGRLLTDKHSACPICGGKDRFRFDNREGRGTWICNVCRAGNGVDLLMKAKGWSFLETAKNIREVIGDVPRTTAPSRGKITADQARDWNAAVWRPSVPIAGTMAEVYLRARRLEGPYPADLRFAASIKASGHPVRTSLPAMLAMVRDPKGVAVSIHRTFLENGGKAGMDKPRQLMPGPIPEGSAVRLSPIAPVLGIAEGIETALAVTRRFGISCWAALNTTLLTKFVPPLGVEELRIFGDNDDHGAGQMAAWALAYRMRTGRRPIRAEVIIPGIECNPEFAGTDWADPINRQDAA